MAMGQPDRLELEFFPIQDLLYGFPGKRRGVNQHSLTIPIFFP